MLGFGFLGRRIFGTANDRALRALMPQVEAAGQLEKELAALSGEAMRARLLEHKEQWRRGRSLDSLLPEVFALTREAAQRTLGQRPFDVQMLGGIVLHQGGIAEMKTGEGKTLAATMPAVLNALADKGVHIVTVNDYLAERDSQWMGQIYQYLGLQVGRVMHGLDDSERQQAYAADITYGTNNELGFDYLRDNMKYRLEAMVQRGHNFAIVDEVDSILIDEARTPLIISGPVEDRAELYNAADALIPRLAESDYEIDEKARQISLSEDGNENAEALLREAGLLTQGNLYDPENISLVHHINQALRARKLYARDKDYIVRDGKVVIIDEFTGRMMPGRRYGDGLHQALEAKEHMAIQQENRILASITFQNYFRLYDTLAGMTGTALTEAEEFQVIYGLPVRAIPTHRPVRRDDRDDQVYRTQEEKNAALVETIAECHARGQPVLAGTVSIEKSEHLSSLLKAKNVPHNVLNARYHEQEAEIIAEAGTFGAVTIATNMAGRGTDIQLGGNLDARLARLLEGVNDEARQREIRAQTEKEIAALHEKVIAQGGLFVLGTERHESRRIDNQLRGRCGRQGDPGVSQFFLSLDDDLMRIFGSDRMGAMLQKIGLQEGEAIVHPWINKALERAQARVEARNFDMRKTILKYDDVMNDQRKAVFAQRLEFIRGEGVDETIEDMRAHVIEDLAGETMPEKAYPEEWDLEGLKQGLRGLFSFAVPVEAWAQEEGISAEAMTARLMQQAEEICASKRQDYGSALMREAERTILLQTLDVEWREHLQKLEHLRQVIGLRGYGQRDPLNEYKNEAFTLFEAMLARLREDVTRYILRMEISREPAEKLAPPPMELHHAPPPPSMPIAMNPAANPARLPASARASGAAKSKTGRNDPCPCGSGRKYKHCHGRNG